MNFSNRIIQPWNFPQCTLESSIGVRALALHDSHEPTQAFRGRLLTFKFDAQKGSILLSMTPRVRFGLEV